MKFLGLCCLTIALCWSAQAEEPTVDFAKDVLPIFEERCMGCHRAAYKDPRTKRTKKPKSGYRMDSAEFILGEGSENEVNIVPEKPDDSPSYTYTTLHEDDDWAMPTKGDRLTKEQQATIKKWIEEGAKLGDWKETKFTAAGDKVEAEAKE